MPSLMRPCMTVRCSRPSCSPPKPDATFGRDSAYRSEEIETQLKTKRLRSKIHYKGSRNKALTTHQQTCNRARSRIRARVEHVFGHQVTAMGGQLIRTIGLVRARAKIGLKNLTYDLQRFLVLTRPRKMHGAEEGGKAASPGRQTPRRCLLVLQPTPFQKRICQQRRRLRQKSGVFRGSPYLITTFFNMNY